MPLTAKSSPYSSTAARPCNTAWRNCSAPRPCGFSDLRNCSAKRSGRPADRNLRSTEAPAELFVENGRWGYRTPQRTVVPPLYDSGFDFTEGLAAVLLGSTWHYIDTAGRTCLSFPGCEAVKPFRNGRAQVVRNGRRIGIDRAGTEYPVAENEFAI